MRRSVTEEGSRFATTKSPMQAGRDRGASRSTISTASAPVRGRARRGGGAGLTRPPARAALAARSSLWSSSPSIIVEKGLPAGRYAAMSAGASAAGLTRAADFISIRSLSEMRARVAMAMARVIIMDEPRCVAISATSRTSWTIVGPPWSKPQSPSPVPHPSDWASCWRLRSMLAVFSPSLPRRLPLRLGADSTQARPRRTQREQDGFALSHLTLDRAQATQGRCFFGGGGAGAVSDSFM
mmetsp:Transcript_7884/g.25906  ORF Transcript_7884/g.25906 Transcript_7884/m.25906 type:complete len:240 (+) Transcript_7884:802-1521(+)